MTSLYENWEDYCSDSSLNIKDDDFIKDESESESEEENQHQNELSRVKTNLSMDAFIKKQKLHSLFNQKSRKPEITIISSVKKTDIIEKEEKNDDEEKKNEITPFLTWGSNKKSTFVPSFNKKFDTDFPILSLSSFKSKKEIKPIQNIIPEEQNDPIITDEKWIDISEKKKNTKKNVENSKTRLCNSIMNGMNCVYGEKCQFAHSSSDLNILECAFGNNCKLIICENNQYKNHQDKVCSFLHPNETKDNFIIRNFKQTVINKVIECIKNDKPIEITIKKNFEKTQICKSIALKKKCSHGKTCKFAHSIDELNVLNCSFADKCKLITVKNMIYSNTNETKICFYKHPSESKANFLKRNKLS